MFLWKCWKIFIYNISHLNSKRWKVKKNLESVTKRWKFSNCNTQILFKYGPKCFMWNVDQFLYIIYESFKNMKFSKFENTNLLGLLPNVFLMRCWPILYITYESFKLQTLKRVKKLKKCYQKMKIFKFKNTNSLWVTVKAFLLQFANNFIYKTWVI